LLKNIFLLKLNATKYVKKTQIGRNTADELLMSRRLNNLKTINIKKVINVDTLNRKDLKEFSRSCSFRSLDKAIINNPNIFTKLTIPE